jgi:hypothetical protein
MGFICLSSYNLDSLRLYISFIIQNTCFNLNEFIDPIRVL